ncbi:unnamed protein product [Ambrosiozyma monospora]|uniref:Unnamed protein product n=1 Tax=Ambrosiozyma monospora TaxID=43982 RepID=A0ACB5THS9_AMBMO|nr:unnamed protein product [Ambrosiozyma monospora]
MDEDDGLMLNFAAPSSESSKPSKTTAKVSGGKWKDRRKAQLKLQGRSKGLDKKKTAATSTSNSAPLGQRRSNQNGKRPANSDGSHPAKRVKETSGESGGKDNTYVSSLFTAAPEIQAREIRN